MSDESKVTEQSYVDGLLSSFGAPVTFKLALPLGHTWTVKGFRTYAEQRRYNEAKAQWVNEMVAAHNAYVKSKDLNAIPVPAFRDLVNLMERENLEAAYDLFSRVIEAKQTIITDPDSEPTVTIKHGFSPAESLILSQAPQLVTKFIDELTYHTAHFLVNVRNGAYIELGKD